MDKLKTIEEALETNPEVLVVDRRSQLDLDHLNGYSKNKDFFHRDYLIQKVSFVVVPKGGLYEKEELQRFRDSLIPGLETHGDRFKLTASVEFLKKYFPKKPDLVYKPKSGGKGWIKSIALTLGELSLFEKVGEGNVATKTFITLEDGELYNNISQPLSKEEIWDIDRKITINIYPDEQYAIGNRRQRIGGPISSKLTIYDATGFVKIDEEEKKLWKNQIEKIKNNPSIIDEKEMATIPLPRVKYY